MRAGLGTIQQTLTPEAATVLNKSIASAIRCNHGQTTPLHVAETLLESPSGILRRACTRSHPNSSHPLQCRALELCFTVALERIPVAQNAVMEPPISNALMAALKRAQANQRRGCPEQQQQPLLAVKVELEHLIISILDDPSVSRVMREAGFSSPTVKSSIEQSLNNSNAQSKIQDQQVAGGNVNFFGASFGGAAPRMISNQGQLTTPVARSPSPVVPLANWNMYSNPGLPQGATPRPIGNPRDDEVKKVFDIMSRSKKRNPILVGDSEPEAVAKELFRKILNKEFGNCSKLKDVEIISMEKGLSLSDKNLIASKIEELGRVIESRIRNGGVILDLGDLKWLVDPAAGSRGGPQQQTAQVLSETGRAVVVEMTKLLSRFRGGDDANDCNKLWLIGTATCETYMRCQVYHSTMESDWGLQAVPVASRSPLPGMFPRLATDRILSNPVESLNPLKAIPSTSPALSNPLKAIPSSLPALSNPLKAIPNTSPALSNPLRAIPSSSPAFSNPLRAIPSSSPALSSNPLDAIQSTSPALSNPLTAIPSSSPAFSNPLRAIPSSSPAISSALKAIPSASPASSNPVESLNPLRAIPSPLPALTRCMPENLDPAQKPTFCPQCSGNYARELAKLSAIEKSLSQSKQDPTRPSLPQWLQNAKLNSPDAKTTNESQGRDQGLLSQQRIQELQKKWTNTCLHLHPSVHQTNRPDKTRQPNLSMTSMYNQNFLAGPPVQPKLQALKPVGTALQLNTNPVTNCQPAPLLARSHPSSPVMTELVLGMKGQDRIPEKPTEGQAKDFLGCLSSEAQTKVLDKFSNALDADTYKKLLKGLMERAWWQAEAASAVASAITRCRLGNGRRRGGGSRGDIWLLFTGPDGVGKREMASVLADQVYGASPVNICLGPQWEDEESDTGFRGKTAVDRIAEAVRRNPFSVIMLKDIDEADVIIRGNIKRALERGRLTDSHGREVGLGSALFIVTGDWSMVSAEALRNGQFVNERKLASTASGSWQLGLIVRDKSAKRRPNWLRDENNRQSRPRKEMGSLSLDLNLLTAASYIEEDKTDESHNSSDLMVDHENELGFVDGHFEILSVPHDLVTNVDDSIVFKPVDAAFVRREIKKTICMKFSMVVDENLALEIGDDVLEKILGGLWHDRTSLAEWIEEVVGPSFEELKEHLPSGDRSNSVVRLVVESDSCDRGKSNGNADWLPSSILV
ncbi:hypothetical protein OROHE_015770 [Orobanche hederae]